MSWNDIPRIERVAHIGRTVIETPSHDRTISVFQKTYDRHHSRPEGTCSFVLGETRAGKTTACEEWMIRLADEIGGTVVAGEEGGSASMTSVIASRDDRIERPVVKVQIDSAPTYERSVRRRGRDGPRNASPEVDDVPELLGLLSCQLTGQRTRLLIFDDVQHIAEHRTVDGVYKGGRRLQGADEDRSRSDRARGASSAAEVKLANDQLREMTVQTHFVRPLALSSGDGGELHMFLAALETQSTPPRKAALCEGAPGS